MQTIASDKQLQLDLGFQLEEQKKKRRIFHKTKKTKFILNNQLSLDDLMKLTYDITDKDFEYFYAKLLEKQGYENVEVTGGYPDEGIDIQASRNGKQYFIQCKQLGNDFVNEKMIGQYYGTIFHKKKLFPNAVFQFVTTSYIHGRVTEFCKGNDIEWIDNGELLSLCNKYNIFTGDNWKNIRLDIYRKRMEDWKKKGFKASKETLKVQVLEEFRNHLPYKFRNKVTPHPEFRIKTGVNEFLEMIELI